MLPERERATRESEREESEEDVPMSSMKTTQWRGEAVKLVTMEVPITVARDTSRGQLHQRHNNSVEDATAPRRPSELPRAAAPWIAQRP